MKTTLLPQLSLSEVNVPQFTEVPRTILCCQNYLLKHRVCQLNKEFIFRLSVLLLTFISYTCYHASRKPISIVKNSREFLDCSQDPRFCHSWITEIDGAPEDEAKTIMGLLDTSYLVSYAVFMFVSGFVAERVDLRLFLSLGMFLSGVSTIMFGAGYFLGVHSIWYLVMVQVVSGVVQTTGWPGVVTVMANWFGKGKRGLIMGLWNSHTSLGNILGALIAGACVNDNWGLSFTWPGVLMIMSAVLIYLFLVPEPSIVGLQPPKQHKSPLDSPLPSTTNLLESEKSLLRTHSSSRLPDSAYNSENDDVVASSKSNKPISFCAALRIPGVVEFSLCLFFAKLVSYTFLFWLPNYISSTSGLDAKSSAKLSTFFDVGGIIGGIIAGVVSDRSGMSASTCAVIIDFKYINNHLCLL